MNSDTVGSHSSSNSGSNQDIWQPRNQRAVTLSRSPDLEPGVLVSPVPTISIQKSSAVVAKSSVASRSSSFYQGTHNFKNSFRSFISRAMSLRSYSSATKIDATVVFLDGTSTKYSLDKCATGHDLFCSVIADLGIEDHQYFGLSYYLSPKSYVTDGTLTIRNSEVSIKSLSDSAGSMTSVENGYVCACTNYSSPCTLNSKHETYAGFNPFFIDVPFWLDVSRKILDQVQQNKLIFYFQVKFYPPHPDLVITCARARHQYCLQLRQHLLTGRLQCSFNSHIILGALIAQADLGDSLLVHPHYSQSWSSRSQASEFGSRRQSHTRSASCAASLPSERTCSLAEPENSDDSRVWNPIEPETTKESIDFHQLPSSSPKRNSTNQFHFIEPEANVVYLKCLPHLSYISTRSISNTGEDTEAQLSILSSDYQHDSLQLITSSETFSPGWPYPKRNCHFCPVMIRRISHLHRRFRGTSLENAERLFLENVKKFALYGVDLHPIKNFSAKYKLFSCSHPFRIISRSSSDRRQSFQSNPPQPMRPPTSGGRCDSCESPRIHENVGNGNNKDHTFRRNFRTSLRGIFNNEHDTNEFISFPLNLNKSSIFDYAVGVYYGGIILQWGHLRLGHFRWIQILEMFLIRHEFHLIVREQTEKSVHPTRVLIIKIKFAFPKLAKRFYRTCVEHHRFFRINEFMNYQLTVKNKPSKPQFKSSLVNRLTLNGPHKLNEDMIKNLPSPQIYQTSHINSSDSLCPADQQNALHPTDLSAKTNTITSCLPSTSGTPKGPIIYLTEEENKKYRTFSISQPISDNVTKIDERKLRPTGSASTTIESMFSSIVSPETNYSGLPNESRQSVDLAIVDPNRNLESVRTGTLDAISKIIVPTHSTFISSDGHMIRSMRVYSAPLPTMCEDSFSDEIDMVDPEVHEQSLSQPYEIPTLNTHVVRFTTDPIQFNEYGLFANTPIHFVNGFVVPTVSTKSLYFASK